MSKPDKPSGRVRSTTAAKADEESPVKADQANDEKGEDAEEADADEDGEKQAEDGDDDTEEADEAEAEETKPEKPATPAAPGLNAPVKGQDMNVIPKTTPKPKLKPIPQVPDGMMPVLSSPRAFGIHIGGVLHRFQAGKTPLDEEQYEACIRDDYVPKNNAEVIYMTIPKASKKKA